MHKSLDDPPGRPIGAIMESITNYFSIYVDHFLQPLAQILPAYICDGIHLLDILKTYHWEPTYFWVCLDVQSLYTSIPHDIGLEAAQNFLSQGHLINLRQAQFILESMHFYLTHN